MKKKGLFLYTFLITMALSFSSCGSQATEDTTGVTSTTVETTPTPEPTATPTPTTDPTSTPTPTTTSESSDKSVDEIAAEESYTLSEQEKADLRALGATEEQINSVKSGQDFVDLVYSLVDSGSNTGKSGSTAGEKEERNITNDFNTVPESDTLPPAQGIPEEDTLPGSM